MFDEVMKRKDCGQLLLLSVLSLYLCMPQIPCVLGGRAYVEVWREEGALCVERLVVFHLPSLPPSIFHSFPM